MTLTAATLVALGLTAAAADQPGPAAISYLDSLRYPRARIVQRIVQPDTRSLESTAISRFVGKEKRLQLARQIELMVKGIDVELPFEVEAEKIDEDLAAVLVRQWQPNNPAGPRWFPLALVRRDSSWLPAPAPGSFENALYGYDPKLRERARSLEKWLMRERATRSVTILDRQLTEMRARMAAKVAPGSLKTDQPDKLIARFLEACRARDMDAALALLGGIQATLPADWPQLHKAVFAGLGNNSSHPLHAPWRLLSDPQSACALVGTTLDPPDQAAHIACLYSGTAGSAMFGPDLPPRAVVLKLPLHHSDEQGWRIGLPNTLLVPESLPKDGRRIFSGNWFTKLVANSDDLMLGRLPGALQKTSPSQPIADHAALARKVLQKLETGNFPDLLPHLALGEDLDLSVLGHERAAELWADVHSQGNGTAILLLNQIAAESTGAIALNLFSAQDPESSDVRVLRTIKGEGGWTLAPALIDLGGAPGIDEDLLAGELALAAARWEKEAPEKILEGAARIGGLPADRAPDSKQARAAVMAWHQAILAGDVKKAVASASLFDNPGSVRRILRTLGHELVGARRNPQPGKIAAANQSGRWAAVSMRIDSPSGPAFPFYAVVLSDDGPRVLPELDLFHGGSRSRNFLNRAVWSRLGDQIPEAAVDELRGLFDQHSDSIGVDQKPPAKAEEPAGNDTPDE